MPTIKHHLQFAATQLKAQGIEAVTANLEAQLLLQHALNVNRAWLIAHEHENLPPSIYAAYRAIVQRRLNGEPIAYVLGYREFYGLNLKVSVDTLIPRADTETLVDAALAKIDLCAIPSPQPSPTRGEGVISKYAPSTPSFPRKRESMLNLDQNMDSRFRGNDEVSNGADNNQLRILDLGTGAGTIALAIAKHHPVAFVYAVDASQAALDIAIENAQNLNITNVSFILSNWFSALKNETFDMIVSNPPYIEANDAHLKHGDLRFEPLSALASGTDGLDAIRAIVTQAPQHLNPHGYLMLEHGYNQAKAVASLLKQAGFNQIETLKDLGGNDRVTLGRLNA